MRELIFHIGMGKCGSTSIQSHFAHVPNETAEYISYPGEIDSNPIIHELIEEHSRCPDSVRAAVARQGEDFSFIRYILSRVQDSSASKLIISAEHVSWLFAQLETNNLVESLLLPASHKRKVNIVCYFRLPAPSRYLSTLQEDAKYNKKIRLYLSDWPYSEVSNVYSRWETICNEHGFGWTPVKFQRDNLVNNDVVQDFSYRVGVEYNRKDRIGTFNQTLSPLVLAALRRVLGAHYDSLPWDRKSQLVNKLATLADRMCTAENINSAFPWKFGGNLEKYINSVSSSELALAFVNDYPVRSLNVESTERHNEWNPLQIHQFIKLGLIYESGYLTGRLEDFLEGIDKADVHKLSLALQREILLYYSYN